MRNDQMIRLGGPCEMQRKVFLHNVAGVCSFFLRFLGQRCGQGFGRGLLWGGIGGV
jgi:hypothetical protein